MKKLRNLFIICLSIIVLNSCSKDDNAPSCPSSEHISMKINGELIQFTTGGRGITLDLDGSGHTLDLTLYSNTFNPQEEPSYTIILKLPYKKRGSNVLEEFYYSRVQNTNYTDIFFDLEEFQSKVTVNKNTCFSATFSGSTAIDGSEISITEGVINIIYDDPF